MGDRNPDLFDRMRLPGEVDAYLREVNPWWEGKPGRVLPPHRRWAFGSLLRRLDARIAPAHGLRASWLEETIPLDPETLERTPHLTDLAGHIAESVVGAFLTGIPNLDVAHFPERAAEPEVDFVLAIGEKRIPIEVKYRRRIDPHRDTLGLRSFLERTQYNGPFGVLVTMLEGVQIPDPRVVPVSLRSLLWTR